MSQDAFAKAFGCNDRQTVSAIETGLRQVKPEELAQFCQILDQPLLFFTDPYVVTEKKAFSYRAKSESKDLATFEKKAHKLISANRRFRELLNEPASALGNQLRNFGKQSSLSAATLCGEQTAKELELGEIPALTLRETIEKKLKVMVFYVDAPASISGAACHLPDGDFMLINRSEASFRRNYDLGHEFFHILTWDIMPPERIDAIKKEADKSKAEKMADAFTAGLLMPLESVKGQCDKRNPAYDIHEWLLQGARHFRVSGQAFYWRVYNSGFVSQKELDVVKKSLLSRNEDADPNGKPNMYNSEFARRLQTVLERGLVSARKAAELLECDLEDLKDFLASYNHPSPFAL